MPRYLFGYVVPKVKLLQLGLTNTLSKVDPGYPGHLVVTLFNVGTTVQRLDRRQAFCQLVLHTVEEGAKLYNKGGKQVEGTPQKGPRSLRIKRWFERNKTWLTILSGGLGGAIVTLVAHLLGSR
jgi:deoxycytidine triphosphate deaminase